jgi:hypothetical protein
VPLLVEGLVDDAGLFPPAALPMAEAVARHRSDEGEGDAGGVLSGRFVCPATRLEELLAELGDGEGIRVALIVAPFADEEISGAVRAMAADDRLELSGLEGPLPAAVIPATLPSGVPSFAEIPVTGDWEGPLAALAALGDRVGAKIRCGGVRSELFPSSEQLGTLVHACARRHVAFKATAGLHHAVRYRDEETGFTHHGFVNLLLAAARASAGAHLDELIEVLDCSEASQLAAEAGSLSPEQARRTRQLFVSYGSCSTSEPVEDLRALGLLEA